MHVLQENVYIVGELELLAATATTSWWLTWLEGARAWSAVRAASPRGMATSLRLSSLPHMRAQ
ncbi:hypothetical protein OAO87_03975 [bacterium]|nr:hypothetical protein [bacterium]